MRTVTKAVIATGVLMLAGAAGFATFATADYGRHGGWQRAGGHHGHHKDWHGGMRGDSMAMLMERFDADKDGKLTQDELNQSRQALLAKHDANKDGKLSLAEYETLWMEVMRQRMVRGFQRTDEDGDASITVDEFLKPFAGTVTRLDNNDDGVLDVNDGKKSWHHKQDREQGQEKERKG